MTVLIKQTCLISRKDALKLKRTLLPRGGHSYSTLVQRTNDLKTNAISGSSTRALVAQTLHEADFAILLIPQEIPLLRSFKFI